MLMQRTMSAPSLAATAAASDGRLGVEGEPDREPVLARAAATPAGSSRRLDVEGDAVAARLGDLLEVVRRVVDHQVAVDHAAGRVDRGAIERSTTGPIVTGGTKCPSPTSKWKTRQPAARSTRSARRAA